MNDRKIFSSSGCTLCVAALGCFTLKLNVCFALSYSFTLHLTKEASGLLQVHIDV